MQHLFNVDSWTVSACQQFSLSAGSQFEECAPAADVHLQAPHTLRQDEGGHIASGVPKHPISGLFGTNQPGRRRLPKKVSTELLHHGVLLQE